jgi:hypothetical protein
VQEDWQENSSAPDSSVKRFADYVEAGLNITKETTKLWLYCKFEYASCLALVSGRLMLIDARFDDVASSEVPVRFRFINDAPNQ